MLSKAEDYECVDVTGLESFITGNILPRRSGGARRALKYEDYLFLREGFLERANWRAAPAARVAPAGRMLNGAAMKTACVTAVRNVLYDYIDADAVLPSGVASMAAGKGVAEDFAERVSGVVLPWAELNALSFQEALKLADLETAYANLAKLKRTREFGFDMSRLFSARTVVRHEKDSAGYERRDSYSGYNFIKLYNYQSGEDQYGYWDASLDEITETPRTDAGYRYAKAATLVLYTKTEIGTTEYFDVCPVALTVANGALSMAAGSLATATAAVLASHGETYMTTPAPSGNKQIYMGIVEGVLVVDHEFPASE